MDAETAATLPLPRFEDRLWDELVPLHPAATPAGPDGRQQQPQLSPPHRRGPRRRYIAALVALAGAAAVLAVVLVVARDGGDRTRLGGQVTTTSATPTTSAAAGDGTAARTTIPEGLNLRQLVNRLTTGPDAVDGFTVEGLETAFADPSVRSSFLPADQPSIEGTLFPDTYELPESPTERDLVVRMVEQFGAVAGDVGLAAGAERLGRTPYEVLTVASIVEEEARFDEERPKIARVLYNRLAQGLPLGVDATICYEKGADPCLLTAEDIESDSPYNTRLRTGLPPTPITSPGRASLDAALHPADGDWLYYLLEADGHHRFTATFDPADRTSTTEAP